MKHLSYLTTVILLSSCKIESQPKKESNPEVKPPEVPSETANIPPHTPEGTPPISELPKEDLRVGERPPQPPKPKKPKYPAAEAVLNKPGYVINPITGGEVDVRGIPPGSLVIDPKDPDRNKFRTPDAP